MCICISALMYGARCGFICDVEEELGRQFLKMAFVATWMVNSQEYELLHQWNINDNAVSVCKERK